MPYGVWYYQFMPKPTREKDPTQIPVQMNFRIPWQLREDLIKMCDAQRVSVSSFMLALTEREVKSYQRRRQSAKQRAS